MAFQGTMFFSADCGGREYGWSESVYLPSATSCVNGLLKLGNLAQARSLLLGAGVSIDYLRCSNQDLDGTGGVFRDSKISVPQYKTFDGKPEAAPIGITLHATDWSLYDKKLIEEAAKLSKAADVRCDFPYSGLLLRVEGVSTNFTIRRSYILRGLPDYMQVTSVPNTFFIKEATVWNKSFEKFASLLASADYGVAALDRTEANPVGKITKWDFTGAQPIVTMAGMAALAVGDTVRISSAVHLQLTTTQTKELNKLWKVESISGNDYKFVGMKTPGGAPTTLKMGSVRKQVHVVSPINNVDQIGWRKRNTGRPFNSPKASSKRKK